MWISKGKFPRGGCEREESHRFKYVSKLTVKLRCYVLEFSVFVVILCNTLSNYVMLDSCWISIIYVLLM